MGGGAADRAAAVARELGGGAGGRRDHRATVWPRALPLLSPLVPPPSSGRSSAAAVARVRSSGAAGSGGFPTIDTGVELTELDVGDDFLQLS